ncbi:MAG: 3 beta-hydroxysteroid dehydrogenase/Delta 5--_4-isomerase [bacterium ADurb.Bin236]|nr:MAG: 3 beta-hydroxysteroid dehydrogenase/Delta 5-->4-isomerase [bacterium ADurb.Bin236]
MKALVTGADGLLGGNLIREMIERGIEARAIVHPKSVSRTLDGLPIERITGDILDAAGLEEAAKGCEAVYHVAASTALWPPKAPIITAVNVEGTRNMLDAAVKAGVKRFVHVGSASSFGYGTKERPGDESTPFKYADFGLAYFDSKLEAQRIALKHAADGKLDVVVVNPTFMIGPFDSGPSSGKMISRFADMRPPFYPPGGRNFIHARDAAKGMLAACERGRTGECYLLGNRNMDMKEFFSEVARVAGFKPPAIEIPKEIMMIAGAAGSAISNVTGKQPELSYEMARSSCVGAYYSAAKAVKELALPQTPIETAVEEAYEWLAENGHIKSARGRAGKRR